MRDSAVLDSEVNIFVSLREKNGYLYPQLNPEGIVPLPVFSSSVNSAQIGWKILTGRKIRMRVLFY